MSQALYRTYRPSTFAEVISQDHIKRTILNQLQQGKVAHAYVFTGPRGVGKTTIARLIAKSVNCIHPKKGEPCGNCEACEEFSRGSMIDVFEIDAASHTDVENVRENIIKSVRFAPNKWKYKVYIIDEVHMLSTSSFNALLKTLEEPPAHVIFILATTEIHKVPQTIISRCQRFDFRRVTSAEMVARLETITKAEKIKVDKEVLHEIARHAEGCVRDAESLLGQLLALGEKEIGWEEASLVLPSTTQSFVLDFLDALAQKNALRAIELCNQYIEQGVDFPAFLDEVIDLLRQVLLAHMGQSQADLVDSGESVKERFDALVTALGTQEAMTAIEAFLTARRYLKTEKIPQLPVELAIVRLCGEGEREYVSKKELEKKDPPSAPPVSKGSKEEEKEESPAPTSKSSSSFISKLSLDEIKVKWDRVFEELKASHGSLPLVIQSGSLEKVEGNEIEMSFDYAFYAETLNQEKNRRVLGDILKQIYGEPLFVRGVYRQAQAEETASQLLEEFGGAVV
ncbi:TPA: DNA polymerase III subunit gamma/tau [Candidatus Uhrbacteria bacterium]|uniref:DNA polymerase III subunit gamma/tau n=2 Tax=Candidatus Uhriibacteriota TaxID=1752732 RepID=A0A0G1Q759_9BACT|nr:MAG: polymerase III, subunit gamma and tau protein [Candidatus Uhrbacteria bacterium GW2011_GWF2_46_218]KKU40839.1 MAG: polymerase III, subunit gamma and tau protein [Candidatus Uhrbacteria bacterium GW2011_GWE2_46_68]HBK33927.1 DNA polymerase III subunit gamma/tau [Candidatus Uhrbacteria bacterium]HCB19648.1 DNA polymerase III subunit gamma/tau [Candidatus Uhrbacteria bacterium]